MDEKNRSVSLTEIGVSRVESILGLTLLDPDRPEDLTPEQARLTGVSRTGVARAVSLPSQQGLSCAGRQGRHRG
jgi:preprotein translocase subunit SecA